MKPPQGIRAHVRCAPGCEKNIRAEDRKLYYNMTITAVSVVVAVLIGGLETLNLIGDQLGLTDGGGFWGAIGAINDNFGVLGYVIIVPAHFPAVPPAAPIFPSTL